MNPTSSPSSSAVQNSPQMMPSRIIARARRGKMVRSPPHSAPMAVSGPDVLRVRKMQNTVGGVRTAAFHGSHHDCDGIVNKLI